MYEPTGDNIWGRITDYLEIAFRYIILNLAWFTLTLPFLAVFFLILRYLFGMETYPWTLLPIPVVLASPAIGGLFYATNQLAHDKDGSLGVFWDGVKTYLWPSYRWGFLNLLVAFLLNVNIWFYENVDWAIAPYVRIAFIVISVFWSTLQIYTFPFLIEQEKPLLTQSFRNSFVATARFPLRSFGLAFLIATIAVVSTLIFPPLWFFITMSFIAYLSNRITLSILKKLSEMEQKNSELQEE